MAIVRHEKKGDFDFDDEMLAQILRFLFVLPFKILSCIILID